MTTLVLVSEQTTLKERLEWVMRKSGFPPEENTGRTFARHCKLKSETQINGFLRGDRKGMTEPIARAIGRATNTSWWWLMRGAGEREPYEGDETGPAANVPARPPAPERTVERDPRYQRLEAVIAYREAKEPGRWGPEAKAAARSRQLRADEDPTVDEWEAFLDAIEAVVRKRASLGPEVRAEDVEAPPRGKRRT